MRQDLCNLDPATSWPPLSALKVVKSQTGESCQTACQKKGIVCFVYDIYIVMILTDFNFVVVSS